MAIETVAKIALSRQLDRSCSACRVFTWFLPGVFWVASCGPAAPAIVEPRRETPVGLSTNPRTVELELVSNATRLDGKPFWLAARFRPPKGAHLYWRNPGETGLATVAEFGSDARVELSPTQYPGPVRFESERGAASYGYLGETVLLAQVAPTTTPAATRFFVRASWLSCDAICVKETGQAELRLSPNDGGTPAALDEFIALLPVPNPDVVATWSAPSAFTLSGPPGTELLEYFPEAPFGPEERAPRSEPQPDGRLGVVLGAAAPTGAPLHAVVRGRTGGETRYFEVQLRPPPTGGPGP